MPSFVLFRANSTLTERVAKAKPAFVKEFSADMSVEDIARQLHSVEVDAEAAKKLVADDVDFFADGTVLSAIKLSETFKWEQFHFLRQDDGTKYDWYVEHIATVANGRPVILIRDCVAHHNTEGLSLVEMESETLRDDPIHIDQIIAKWVKRLARFGIVPEVREHFYSAKSRRSAWMVDPELLDKVSGAVIIADHHGCQDQQIILERGGVYFNAYPGVRDNDLKTGAG